MAEFINDVDTFHDFCVKEILVFSFVSLFLYRGTKRKTSSLLHKVNARLSPRLLLVEVGLGSFCSAKLCQSNHSAGLCGAPLIQRRVAG